MTREPAAYRRGVHGWRMGWRKGRGAVSHWRITGMDLEQGDAYPGLNFEWAELSI